MSFSKLDRPRIVAEALDLLQDVGLSGVSLRKVAARLDVGVASLYWHVKDKDELYGLMSETVFRSCLLAVPAAATWQHWLRGFGLALWEAQNMVRDARQLIVQATMDTEVRRGMREEIVSALARLGLEPVTADAAQRSVQALITGWTTLQRQIAGPDAADRAELALALDSLIAGWTASTQVVE